MHYKQSKNHLNSAFQLNPEIFNTLETKRLYIKQINHEEFNIIDKELHQRLEMYTSQSFFSEGTSENKLIFSITSKDTSQLLGLIFLKALHAVTEMECYFILLPQFRGSGYAIEALKKTIEFIFSTLNVENLIAYVNQDNKRGWLVLERSGLKYMGDVSVKQKNKKIMVFSMNRNDFDNRYRH
jgi:RimJ/RimL family protein N-acetyltransferase